jgi:phosphonate transport system substrate-binding protein
MRSIFFLLAVSCLIGVNGCGNAGPPVLRFTAIPDKDTTRMKEKFQPVAAYLEKTLGVKVEYVHATKYSASVEMFKNEEVLLAWFGGLTGVQARAAVAGARAIAQGVEDPKYHSYFIAHKDAGIERGVQFPAAIVGKRFTFGSKSSTSGRLMPEYFMRQQSGGKSPAEYLGSEPQFSGSHDKTCELVEKGAVQTGAVSYTTYDRRVAEGTTDPAVCKVIWQTPDYPDYNFTAHPALDAKFGEGFTERLQAALIAMKDPELLSSFERTGMIKAINADFQPIHDLAVELGLLR